MFPNALLYCEALKVSPKHLIEDDNGRSNIYIYYLKGDAAFQSHVLRSGRVLYGALKIFNLKYGLQIKQ